MDKLRAIRCFCRTVETKSFTQAAKSLDVPQSVLSKAISALEADLKFTLLNRSTRRLSLTEAGMRYYERCREILLDMEEAEAAARLGMVQAAGTLRIGIHPVFQISLCRRISEFLAANPRVDVEITHTNSPAALVEEGLDVILRMGRITESSVVIRRLGSSYLTTCASPAYLDAHGRPSHPQDLTKHCAIIPGRRDEDMFTRWTFAKGNAREVVHVPVRIVLHEGVGLGLTAVGGLGIVRLYDIAARPFIDEGSLELVLKDWSSEPQMVLAVIPKSKNVPIKVRAFIEFARSLVLQ